MIWRVWDCGDEICGTLFFIFPARRECKKIDSFVGSKQNFVEYLKKKYGGTGKTIKLVYEVLPNSVGEGIIVVPGDRWVVEAIIDKVLNDFIWKR